MSSPSVPSARSAVWKWGVTGLLLLATTVNYMDRVALANASVRVTTELGLSNQEYGHLELAFGWAFAAGSLVFGILADRLRVFLLYPAVLLLWSLMGAASAWSEGFGSLLFCRTLLGFFEAGHWPCALKITFALLPPKERTMGNSILQSGASLGAILTPQLMKWLMSPGVGAWRNAFVIVGASGLVWVLLWFGVVRSRDLEAKPAQDSVKPKEPADAKPPQPPPPLTNREQTLWEIVCSRPFWALALLIAGAQAVWHIPRVWLAKFLQSGRGYSETAALDFSSVYYLATDAGCILAGVLSLWIARRFHASAHAARRRVYAGACVLTSLSVCIPWLGKGPALLGVLLCVGAGALALFPCYYAFVQELSARHVGRLTGLLSMWVWSVTSPMHSAFGALADRTQSFDAGLVLAGLTPWLGVLSMRLLWDSAPPEDGEKKLSSPKELSAQPENGR